MATKAHLQSNDPDTNLFTDADLSILGQDWNIYSKYYKNIIMEYSIYMDGKILQRKKKSTKLFSEFRENIQNKFFL
ncbi:hypothetical protein [Leptospira noguchii]|uniref:hypothetical protein n=1 Tax=Leptospira noguchii TaxID=28182 RepID=UPI000566FBC1|nr:hypothetical protein [Leptospira noguchii]